MVRIVAPYLVFVKETGSENDFCKRKSSQKEKVFI